MLLALLSAGIVELVAMGIGGGERRRGDWRRVWFLIGCVVHGWALGSLLGALGGESAEYCAWQAYGVDNVDGVSFVRRSGASCCWRW